MPRIELICFGTELLRDKVNTNAVAIAERLMPIGMTVARVQTVGDDPAECEDAIRDALKRADVVLTCGGLGPTFDDLTRECVSRVTGRRLRFVPRVQRHIAARFRKIKLPMPAENNRQAEILQGAKVILNPVGTAPGQILRVGKKTIIILPGPPSECLPMMEREVRRELSRLYPGRFAETLMLHIFGFPESQIDEMIQPVVQKPRADRDVEVIFGILAHQAITDVKATVLGRSKARVRAVLKQIRREFDEVLGARVYGEGAETLPEVVGRLLKQRKQTLAFAESCTGGLAASRITDIAGSSDYFLESVVTYSNASKVRLLGVRTVTLQRFGAVSRECAREMADGLRKRSGADWAISITGIAGPGGGSKEKPVGTVCFGIASEEGTVTLQRHFLGHRVRVKERSAMTALDLLRKALLGQPLN